MQALSGSTDGFGGDLRYGHPDGLSGADAICADTAERSLAGAREKQWRAFLSTRAVDAIDRVGDGPWYDRLGRLVARDRDGLQHTRPKDADPAIVDDLPNEYGVPNHDPDGTGYVDNHDVLTGSDAQGRLFRDDATCDDWTSVQAGTPRAGHCWPQSDENGRHWISEHELPGCAPGMHLADEDAAGPAGCVGCAGGYGAIYCLALVP
ncbi:MAG: hypothetical protein JW940_07960 [Polyangiaceae bacterium]|nr:hypothetical protein [Polyangiaceae bacterium]